MNLRERYYQMLENGYDNEDGDYDEEEIDIEGAKRKKKKKKKGGCCGGVKSKMLPTYQKMLHAIAVHNRKPGTKKYKVSVGSSRLAVEKAYKKIKGMKGGAPIVRDKDMDEAFSLITKSTPFNIKDNTDIIKDIRDTWPIGDQEDFINAVLDGRIKTTQGLKRYYDENVPLENVLEEPFEDSVVKNKIRCNYNKETMDLCRRISKLEREFKKKHGKDVAKSAFL